ncbi:hypothetical protein MFIFM68171_02739 [Madurella fahalii]|uniref:Leucine-rich repeat domain-containing protein n=1 Tax=Madurella fahalii TaxID=1157608 RepID=A0ABQ0G456_9PEZI
MEQGRGILDLPNEILDKIVGQFCQHCAGDALKPVDSVDRAEFQGTLIALTKVNRRMGRVARRILFHVVSSDHNSLPKLLRILMEQPAFAPYIRVVDLGGHAGDQDCALHYLPEQGAEELGALVKSVGRFEALPAIEEVYRRGSLSARPPLGEFDRVPGARFNVFVLFKLAKNINSVIIRSEWPLAVFAQFPTPAEIKDKLKIKVVNIESKTKLKINLDRTVPLSGIQELHLTSNIINLWTAKHVVDLSKAADLLVRLPNLRRLSSQGSTGSFCTAIVGDSVFSNLTELDLASCSLTLPSLRDILSSCSAKLKRFRFSCESESDNTNHIGTGIAGADIIQILDMAELSGSLHSLEVDTSDSETFTNIWGWPTFARNFRTIPSLGHFASLRHLCISADNIYFPAMSPGMLVQDDNSGPLRLVQFLPAGLETLEITGITAIHLQDVEALAQACEKRDPLHALKRIVFRADGALHLADVDDEPEQVMEGRKFENMAMAELFAAAGVEYEFEQPEFFTTFYSGTWDSI